MAWTWPDLTRVRRNGCHRQGCRVAQSVAGEAKSPFCAPSVHAGVGAREPELVYKKKQGPLPGTKL
jgi:hypothetical protein